MVHGLIIFRVYGSEEHLNLGTGVWVCETIEVPNWFMHDKYAKIKIMLGSMQCVNQFVYMRIYTQNISVQDMGENKSGEYLCVGVQYKHLSEACIH